MTGHVPIRRCVACGQRRPQAELLRLFRDATGTLVLSGNTPRQGRGAYCCSNEACRIKAIDKRLYARSLRGSARIADRDQLLCEMASLAAKMNQTYGVEDYGENHR